MQVKQVGGSVSTHSIQTVFWFVGTNPYPNGTFSVWTSTNFRNNGQKYVVPGGLNAPVGRHTNPPYYHDWYFEFVWPDGSSCATANFGIGGVHSP